jgi:hypothetical protein
MLPAPYAIALAPFKGTVSTTRPVTGGKGLLWGDTEAAARPEAAHRRGRHGRRTPSLSWPPRRPPQRCRGVSTGSRAEIGERGGLGS